MANLTTHENRVPAGWKCPGCGRREMHKLCPAWGTPFYMSGELFTAELEAKWAGARREAMKKAGLIEVGKDQG